MNKSYNDPHPICDVLIFDLVVLWYSKPSMWNMIAYCIVPTWKTIVLVVMFDPCCPSYLSIFSVWLSARWALHSPDNHQRIIFHALCLVKLCALYICWKIKLLLLLHPITNHLCQSSLLNHNAHLERLISVGLGPILWRLYELVFKR